MVLFLVIVTALCTPFLIMCLVERLNDKEIADFEKLLQAREKERQEEFLDD
jgi:hypothetical protein